MKEFTQENVLKELLTELANTVEVLPSELRPSAFATLLSYRLAGGSTNVMQKNTIKPIPSAENQSENIGEYLASFKSDLREDEKLLAAILFNQISSEENSTTIEIAHSSLKDVGIKLSNAGVFGKQLLKKKLIFATGKAGKSMKLRVSAEGNTMLQKLMTTPVSI